MKDSSFIIDTMTWSFSRLNYSCLREFYLHYIESESNEDSFYGQYGTFIHSILQKYAEGELSLFDLSQYYEDHFNEEVTLDAPYNKYINIKESYYNKGLDYLDNIDLNLDDYDILGVEKEVHFEIDDIQMVGYIDLLLKEKETGRIIILDHKSAKLKILKNGTVSKSDQQHFLEFKRQLYLYSKAVLEEYGHVDELKWNLFNERNWISVDWNKNEYDEAIDWAKNTVKKLRSEIEWKPKEEYYYCKNLCGQRYNCEFGVQPKYYNPMEYE